MASIKIENPIISGIIVVIGVLIGATLFYLFGIFGKILGAAIIIYLVYNFYKDHIKKKEIE